MLVPPPAFLLQMQKVCNHLLLQQSWGSPGTATQFLCYNKQTRVPVVAFCAAYLKSPEEPENPWKAQRRAGTMFWLC